MDVENSDVLKETINFVENIEFSEFQLKTKIKKEEGLNQEVWKPSPFDVKPKFEQLEACEIDESKIKAESEEFFSNDEAETLCKESLDIKDEFMWAIKDFVSDNDPTKNIEDKIIAVPENKPIVIFTGKAGENNYKCQNIADVHENEKPFVCSSCPSKFVKKIV